MEPIFPLVEWCKSLIRRTKFVVKYSLSISCSIYPLYASGKSGSVCHPLFSKDDGRWYYLRGFIPYQKSLNHNSREVGIIICHVVRMTKLPLWGGNHRDIWVTKIYYNIYIIKLYIETLWFNVSCIIEEDCVKAVDGVMWHYVVVILCCRGV